MYACYLYYCKLQTISYAARYFFLQCLNLLSADCCCVQSGAPCIHSKTLYKKTVQHNVDDDILTQGPQTERRDWKLV
jgi:hypothetical protein